jgi:hypothetical protein
MEDTGEDADARLPRVALPHQHRGYQRDGGHGYKKTKTTKRTRGRTWEKTPRPERKRDRVEPIVAADLNSDNPHDATQHYRLRLYPCPEPPHVFIYLFLALACCDALAML